MATAKRKARAAPAETNRAPEPSWRQPPARPRKRRQRLQTSTPQVIVRTAETRRPGKGGTQSARPPLAAGIIVRRVGLVALLAGLAAGALFLLRAPQLMVSASSTQIGGLQRVAQDRVYAISGVEGRNIFLIRPDEVAARIAQEPGIAEAAVHVRLPNQVLIDVREHVPLAAYHGITTTVWLTAEGVTLPEVGEPPPLQLNDRTGLGLAESKARWPQLLPVLQALHQALPQVTEVYYGQLEGLYYRAPEGWTVWLGDGERLAAKLALLASAGKEIVAQGARPEVIDLRYSDRKALWW